MNMNIEDLTDKQLMDEYYESIENQDGNLTKKLSIEMNRRNAEL